MGKKMNKCKAPGCSKWILHDQDVEFCAEHHKPDLISALYVDKTPEQVAADEHVCDFFSYLLQHCTLEEMLS